MPPFPTEAGDEERCGRADGARPMHADVGRQVKTAWHRIRMRTLVGIYRCSRPCLLPASARLGWGVSCNISSIFLFTSHATRKLLRKTREFHIDNKRIRKMTTKNVLTRRLNRKKKKLTRVGCMLVYDGVDAFAGYVRYFHTAR